jgi:Holliday junction DNA helicase RuvA
MYEYIIGNIIELKPTYVIIDHLGLAYKIEISLQTYSHLQKLPMEKAKVFLYQIIREDAHLLFGFSTKKERELFKLLISVSGIGANTSRTILSATTPEELQNYIQQAKVSELKSIKGIGQKTAERLIVELRDKLGKSLDNEDFFALSHNTIKDEALSALLMLGFSKNMAEKILDKIVKSDTNLSTEELIKQALKLM